MFADHLLSILTVFPVIGAAVICLIPNSERSTHRLVAAMIAFGALILSVACLAQFDLSSAGMQFFDEHRWVSTLNISYSVGIDGLNVFLVSIAALLFFLSIVASKEYRWTKSGAAAFSDSGYQISGAKGFFAMTLLLQSTIFGMCLSQDLFLFFVFFLMAVIPIYFLLGVWGGKGREQAATEYLTYQLIGGVLILVGMMLLYYAATPHTFDLRSLGDGKFSGVDLRVFGRDWSLEKLAYVLMFAGFAIRVALVPFHTWLPKVLSEAPPTVSMVLTSVVPAAAAYGFMRINYGLFTEATKWFKDALAILAVVSVIYSSFCALGQRDLRRILAYSSIGQMGFVFFGLTVLSSSGLHGALLAAICACLINALLTYLVSIVGARVGHFNISAEDGKSNLGGLVLNSPWLSSMFALSIFSAIGFPGFGLFGPRTLIFLGAFQDREILTLVGIFGTVVTSAFLLGAYRRIFLGKPGEESGRVHDLTLSERALVIPMVALILFLGISPGYFMRVSESTVSKMIAAFDPNAPRALPPSPGQASGENGSGAERSGDAGN